VTQGSEVGGYPSKILSLLKTTLFVIILFINSSYSENDAMNQIFAGFDIINNNSFVKIPYYKDAPETADEASSRIEKEKRDMDDVRLNKAEIADGRYYVNKQWVSTKYTKPFRVEDIKDTDKDGYDDYTEFINGTNPKDDKSFPIIRNGNNKKIFK
jgi:hypothetical protein